MNYTIVLIVVEIRQWIISANNEILSPVQYIICCHNVINNGIDYYKGMSNVIHRSPDITRCAIDLCLLRYL